MSVYVNFHTFTFEYPAREKPLWAESVERWSQLDAYAYGLPEAYSNWKNKLGQAAPDLVFLASPESSNRTDYSFAQMGASSPSKFVHTLPNSRSAALLQVMGWAGRLLCFQNDPVTQQSALVEAADFSSAAAVWVFSVIRLSEQNYEVQLFEVLRDGPAGDLQIVGAPDQTLPAESDDFALRHWLKNKDASAPFLLLNRYLLKKLRDSP